MLRAMANVFVRLADPCLRFDFSEVLFDVVADKVITYQQLIELKETGDEKETV
jgi:hypothetical protein